MLFTHRLKEKAPYTLQQHMTHRYILLMPPCSVRCGNLWGKKKKEKKVAVVVQMYRGKKPKV